MTDALKSWQYADAGSNPAGRHIETGRITMVRRNTKTYVGKMCKHGHHIEGTSSALRYSSGGTCVECNRESNARNKSMIQHGIDIGIKSHDDAPVLGNTEHMEYSNDVLRVAAEIDTLIGRAVSSAVTEERKRIMSHFSTLLA